ncbi:MAG: gliding motility lipoprotein GldD [Bacteroidota bacterium]
MRIFLSLVVLSLIFFLTSCHDEYIPKPKGYFRIDLPEKSYQLYCESCPYCFEHLLDAKIIYAAKDSCWIDIYYPMFDAMIYLTHKSVENNLDKHLEETHQLAYKHTIKADAINEYLFPFPDKKVYAVLYEIKGDAASSVNFYITDSTDNFVRGALYFNVAPNKDSLMPVIDFITDDIAHLIETFKWKELKP